MTDERINKLKNDKNYHGFVHTLLRSDKRIEYLLNQYDKDGFDDSETWSLFNTITSFILPRLKRFREIEAGYPMGMTQGKWNKIIDKMIIAFELIDKDECITDKQYKQQKEGLRLFAKHFQNLWW